MVDETNVEAKSLDTALRRPGTLYVMYEMDHLTKETFEYYKIGIVLGERDVLAREKDHKTGNPRGIYTKFEIACQQVQKLETILHNKYAYNRVSSGEWFRFKDDQLTDMWSSTVELCAKLDLKIDLFERAKNLSKLEHRAGEVQATSEILSQAKYASELEMKIETCEKLMKVITNKLKSIHEQDRTIEFLMKKSTRAASYKFSATELKKRHPNLHQEFQVPKLSWASSFLVIPEISEIELSVNIGNPALVEKLNDPYDLHQEYLRLWSQKSELALELEIAKSTVISFCGSNLAISDVFQWTQTVRNSFDSDTFKAKHPNIYSDCFRQTEAKQSFSVAEWASYERR